MAFSNVFQFIRDFWHNQEDTIRILQNYNVLAKERPCPYCGRILELNTETIMFRCGRRSCNYRKMGRVGTLFENTTLSIRQVTELAAFFMTLGPPRQKMLMEYYGYHPRTIVKWFNKFKGILILNQIRNFTPIGGPGVVVEIDESKFGKRKSNVGRVVDGIWLFGGIERASGRCFVVPVLKRDSSTLLPLIKKYILPGTTVMSDMWGAYRCLSQHGYDHHAVNHSRRFVDGPDRSIHTQNIERLWRDVRGGIPRFGRKKRYMIGYLAEFLFKREHGSDSTNQFFRTIGEIIPAEE